VVASGRERVWDATNSSTPPKIHSLSSSTPVNYNYTSNITIDGQMHRLQNFDFSNGAGFTGCYCYNNTVIEDLHALALCLPESYFVWGFSSLLVYIVISTQIVWFFGMYVVWLDANINSALCRTGRKVRGHFRAAADLSEAAREVLGKQICAYTDEELSRELCMQPGIRYYTEDAQDGDVAHIGLSSRRLPRVHVDDTKLYGGQDKDI